MPTLKIIFVGRLLGKKNQHSVHRLGKNGRYTIGLKAESKAQIEELKTLAMVAVAEQGWEMPPPKAPLHIRYWQYSHSVRSGDLDNAATTAFDAFQGIVYHNDMYITHIEGDRTLIPKSQEERTEFEISA